MPANPNYSEENIAKALKSLLNENVDITAAALAYRLGAPRSTITRSSERLAAVEAAVEEQRKIRAVVAGNKSSNEALIAKLVRREKTIATLERRIEILTASHSAMLMAVGEIGGVAAWRKFFPKWEAVRAELEALGAEDQLDENSSPE
jgi:hypothetical protein